MDNSAKKGRNRRNYDRTRQRMGAFLWNLLVFASGFLFCYQYQRQRQQQQQQSSWMMQKVEKESPSSSLAHDNGWHSIEVFYGKADHFERKQTKEMMELNEPLPQDWVAQVNQDVIVSRLLGEKKNGYFVDLASNAAVFISNTYSLERKVNWTGLCIEPNPIYWSDLVHRNCQVVAAIVGGTRMEEVAFSFPEIGYMGGIVGAEFDNHDATGAEMKYTVPLQEILWRFSAPAEMDYLSLDVEGAELLVMQHFPFDEYSFKVLTVERPNFELQALLKEQGYECVGTISVFGETLWVRTAIKDSLYISRIQEFITSY